MITSNPFLIEINVIFSVLAFMFFIIYLYEIRVIGIINRLVSNIMALPVALTTIFGIYEHYISIGTSYNLSLYIHHIQLKICLIVLCTIGIYQCRKIKSNFNF